ncbi:MAG: hypothetical protein AB3N18_04615 [Allomuricauda sp.]
MEKLQSIVYNLDCNDPVKGISSYPDNHWDYALIDPNWGIGETKVDPKSRNTPVKQSNGKSLKIADKDYSGSNWDNERPSREFFEQLFRVTRYQIIKGGNHFTDLLPVFSSGRVVWDKVNGKNDFSDCEIFWTNCFESVRIFYYMWHGMMQGESLLNPRKQQGDKKLNEKRIHRCQTPVKVYDWFYKNIIPEGSKVLDTHLGSGSNRISAYKAKCHFTGFEIGKKEFDDQEARWTETKSELDSMLNFINLTG